MFSCGFLNEGFKSGSLGERAGHADYSRERNPLSWRRVRSRCFWGRRGVYPPATIGHARREPLPIRPPKLALEPLTRPDEFSEAALTAIKVIGQLRKTPWERFARLQRTAARLTQGKRQPKGVFRFSSHEACDAWTANLDRDRK
jgi:hypothetical protein